MGREIVSVVWYPHRPDWHEVVYSDGDFSRLAGTLGCYEVGRDPRVGVNHHV